MVFKIEKTKNYTVMSNYHLQDKNLSYKAKGLLSFMLSLPEDWDYSLAGLVSVSKENIKAIRTILNELKDNGYLAIEQDRGEKGYYKYNYIIYEQPIIIEKDKDNPDTQKGYAVEGNTEKDIQINTNIQNTKEQINKINKTIDENELNNNSSFLLEEHHNLTKDLVKRKYLDIDDVELFKYDNMFNNLLNRYEFEDVVVICHYIVSSVVGRNFKNEYGGIIENKFGYLRQSILNNIDKFKNNEIEWDDEVGWFKELQGKENDYEYDYEIGG